MLKQREELQDYTLNDRYILSKGRVFLTGTQALVRVMLDQARRDQQAGLNTAGFISGYRGSPLGGLDQELWHTHARLQENNIEFMPAVNEDLAATAILGSQQAVLDMDCTADGIFSMWYGKGPGVDRSGDALRHGNAYGSSPKGGVLVVAGDDHGCVSSSMPHQSDVAFMTWFIPTLNPASVSEYLEFGEYGIALSRFSGTWVGFKAISETVESARSVELKPDRVFHHPKIELPPGGLHVRRSDLPSTEIEERIGHKLTAVEAFVEANPIDRRIYNIKGALFGIVTTGKAHHDLMEALRLLGLDEGKCRHLGIDIYKVAMVWPLARRDALDFVRGKDEVLVIEEKRGIIESQFKEYFYDWPGDKPAKMVGKHDAQAIRDLVPWTGELSPRILIPIVAERLHRFFPEENLIDRATRLTSKAPVTLQISGATRTPYFCSGCPHNISTKVPDGSAAASGIGCHVMASWMDRQTEGYAQMGGEGVPWIVRSKFNGGRHMFQNLGEGTWYHSGSLAIRQAVAANTNITFKILFNDAVAMTGGQPVDGPITVSGIAQTCQAEGVSEIAIVSNDIEKFRKSEFPASTTFHDRADLDLVQRKLRDIEGVSVLIYEQACATETRRRRKRGKTVDPKKFAYINPMVCEGCGDCSVESNCLSVEPLETPFGRKRKINLSTCNKDYSCLNGFCPSFVTVEGVDKARPDVPTTDFLARAAELQEPEKLSLQQPYNLLVAGVGGTGVITIGALITMASHLEGLGTSLLDFTGFAQKFGTVLSYIRIAQHTDDIHQARIELLSADAVIGCDMVVASSPKASQLYNDRTNIVLNTAEMPTGDLVLNRDARLHPVERTAAIASAVGQDNLQSINANELAERLLGDAVFANTIMLGLAFQKGLLPVGLAALDKAIEMNGVKIAENRIAFAIGRLIAADLTLLEDHRKQGDTVAEDFSTLLESRKRFLIRYQDEAYARRFVNNIENFVAKLPPEHRDHLGSVAIKSLFKIMAYKDEYEVARLHTDPQFVERLKGEFGAGFKLYHYFSPPFLPVGRDHRGRPRKLKMGPWIRPLLHLIAKGKGIRGTFFDIFSYTSERRIQLELIDWFENILQRTGDNPELYCDSLAEILASPTHMRGYGPILLQSIDEQKRKVENMLSAAN